ncbi:MAG: hypothetical protein QN158_07630 [Armatimonadota bacterium]|nr:hypothetical protein [Armatimonadota bacterium]
MDIVTKAWRVGAAIAVLAGLIASPVAGQGDTPAVAAARKLFGDYRVIPGERIGSVRLGEATRDDFRSRWELTNTYGLRRDAVKWWHWPEHNMGRSPDFAWDQPFEFFFCSSNSRLFASYVFNAGSWYPDHPMFWLFMQRLVTPEGLEGRHPFTRWLELNAKPVEIRTDLAPAIQPWKTFIFENGLLVGEPGGLIRPVTIGVYNLDICRGEPIKGVYLPFLGRSEVVKLATSKSGDLQRVRIGPETSEFGNRDKIFILLELAFPPTVFDAGFTFFVKAKFADGSERIWERVGRFRAPRTSYAIAFELAPEPSWERVLKSVEK